jgi:hypothetical protein
VTSCKCGTFSNSTEPFEDMTEAHNIGKTEFLAPEILTDPDKDWLP